MVRRVASFLGPSALEIELRDLKQQFGLFYLRNEQSQRVLDNTLPGSWNNFTRCYALQLNTLDWYLDNMEICLENVHKIDSRKEIFDTDLLTMSLYENYGYMVGLSELRNFVCYTDTNVIDRASVLKFIRFIKGECRKEYPSSEIYTIMKELETNLNLLSSLLKREFRIGTYLEMKLY